jgi:hypothetical protein
MIRRAPRQARRPACTRAALYHWVAPQNDPLTSLPVGSQFPGPGQNEITVVYGGVDYAPGQVTSTIALTKSGANFLVFMIALL